METFMPQIKVTLETLVKSMDALREIGTLKQPVLNYKIAKVINAVQTELGHYGKSRNALITECAEKNEDGTVKVDGIGNPTLKNPAEFAAAHQLLLDTETEITVPVIPAADLSNAEISGMSLSALTWLLVDEEQDKG
jgi:hypothetical protein